MKESNPKPKIVAFTCLWCTGTKPELVKTTPVDVKYTTIDVMCSGRVNPSFIMHSFHNGADGVIIFGCQDGKCHYHNGNELAKKNVRMTKKLLHTLGINPDRLKLVLVDVDHRDQLKRYVRDFSNSILKMGR